MYVYDKTGNLVTMGAHTMQYDAEGHMVSGGLGGGTAFQYDGEGRRVKKITGTGASQRATTYVYDAQGQLAAEYGDAAAMGCTTCYLVTDHLGSTRMLVSQSGAVTELHDYAPFGEELAIGVNGRTAPYAAAALPQAANNTGARELFTGKERDVETGLDYFGARYFSAAMGRFTSADPVMSSGRASDPQSWNRYAYGRNNPLLYVDPTGTTYQICDMQGHCENNYSDEDFRKNFQKNKGVILAGGKVYSRNANGKRGDQIGTFAWIGEELDQKGSQVVSDLGSRADATKGLIAGVAGLSVAGGAVVAAAPAVGAAVANGVATTVGWGYGLTGGTGVVLGSYSQYPNYIDAAKSIGANVYNIPGWLWSGLNAAGQAWTANRAFLDASMARGQQFYLSTAPTGATGAYAQELEYLTSKGISPSQWAIVPLPF